MGVNPWFINQQASLGGTILQDTIEVWGVFQLAVRSPEGFKVFAASCSKRDAMYKYVAS